jgi:XTP/dITP diphosphohydrolase
MDSTLEAFKRLLIIQKELREKCPWDKKQTIESLRMLTIEETYELVDAIDTKNFADIKEELGDVLLHILFYACIAEEKNEFTFAELINEQCEKLIRRHPHIYGEVKVNDEHEVKQNWEKLKIKEGKKSVLGGVPKSLPAIPKAYRIQEKAAQVGFDWKEKEPVLDKIEEELQELKEAQQKKSQPEIEEEMGDLLFSIVNYCRFIKVDPEAALEKTNRKFKSRFEQMENVAGQSNKQLKDMTLEEMDVIWNTVKKNKV